MVLVSSAWLTTGQAQDSTASIVLTAGNPDAEGAQIRIDGQPAGTVPHRVSLESGRHLVQVGRQGFATFNQWVDLTAGQVLTLSVNLVAEASSTGSIFVTASAPNTIIRVDGQSIGAAPVTVDDLEPGQHLVEATADGYASAAQSVTVTAGQQTTVTMQLSRVASHGEIVVTANVADASVSVDGQPRGLAPVVVSEMAVGTHVVVVNAAGHEELRTTCRVEAGETCSIDAQLAPLLGGQEPEVPEAPPEDPPPPREVPPPREAEPEPPSEPRGSEREVRREVVSRAAMPVPGDMTVLDASIGWIHLAEIRMGVGVFSFANDEAGLLAGFGMRSFGRVTEFEGRFQVGYRPIRQVSVGGALRLGGGFGPGRDPTESEVMAAQMMGTVAERHPTNSFSMALEGIASLHFSQAGAFSIWLGADFYSDRWDWLATNRDMIDPARVGSRQKQARLRLGGSLEIVFSDRWNGWILLEGVIADPSAPRALWSDFLGTGRDRRLYFRIGFTHKFGVPST